MTFKRRRHSRPRARPVDVVADTLPRQQPCRAGRRSAHHPCRFCHPRRAPRDERPCDVRLDDEVTLPKEHHLVECVLFDKLKPFRAIRNILRRAARSVLAGTRLAAADALVSLSGASGARSGGRAHVIAAAVWDIRSRLVAGRIVALHRSRAACGRDGFGATRRAILSEHGVRTKDEDRNCRVSEECHAILNLELLGAGRVASDAR